MTKSIKLFIGITGALILITGILFLCNPGGAIFSMAWLLGLFVLLSGISELVFVLNAQRFIPNSGTRVLSAVFQILLGGILLAHPLLVSVALPVIFSIWVMAEGVIAIVKSFDYKQVGYKFWWGSLILGLAGAILGFLGLFNIQAAGKTLGVLIGLALIFEGISYFVMLGGINRFEKAVKEKVGNFIENNTVDNQ